MSDQTVPESTPQGDTEELSEVIDRALDGMVYDVVKPPFVETLVAAVSPILERQRLARNGAQAMMGVHKRRADNLRRELDHAKAALAGDDEGVRLFIADCERRVERLKGQAELSARGEQEAEAVLVRLRAELAETRERALDLRVGVMQAFGFAVVRDDEDLINVARKTRAERDALKRAVAEVRRLQKMTIAASCRADAIDQATDTLAALDRALDAPGGGQ